MKKFNFAGNKTTSTKCHLKLLVLKKKGAKKKHTEKLSIKPNKTTTTKSIKLTLLYKQAQKQELPLLVRVVRCTAFGWSS